MKRCPECQGACWDAHKHCPACGADVSDAAVTDGDPLIGITVGGKFVLREVLGEGAMGKVYRADQTNLGRTVAVKVMNPVLAADEGLVRRFHDEARSASRLNHPNIVSVIDYGQSETGLLYIVMEYLRGRTLARLIAEEAPLPAVRIVSILGQVLDALEEAHANDVVHRDLKPDNIMVDALRTSGDFAKVLDFGIAKLKREDRDFETIDGQCGTPEYMAPEQVRGQLDVDARADLYSLGIVMYEMVTGLTPFAGGSHAEVFSKQLNYAPKPPRRARPDVPISPAIEAIVLKALEKDRLSRYASAAAMKAALEAALERETTARRSSMPGLQEPVTGTFRSAPPDPGSVFPLPPRSRPEWRRLDDIVTVREHGRAAMLIGPDGAGKTQLSAYARRAAENAGRAVLRGYPDHSGARRTWYPVRELCRDVLQLRGKPTVEMLAGALERASIDPVNMPGLCELFGLAGENGLDGAARMRECMASSAQVLRVVGAERKALVLLEDIDRWDAPSRELCERLLESPGAGPLVILATQAQRPGAPKSSTEILELVPFEPAEVAKLTTHALGEAPTALVSALMTATAGLPLHVDQLLRYLCEGGGEPTLGLADTIDARIARLPLEARTLLQTVSLAGGTADQVLLEAVGVQAVQEPLRLLEKFGFAGLASGRVRVRHPLFTEVACAGIPEEARRVLHARLWSALEARDEDPAVLGRHAYEARDRRAVPLLERAGDAAKRLFDDAGAAVHLRRAVELQRWALMEGQADSEEAFVRLSVRLGEALFGASDMVGAEGVLREALGYAQGHPAAEARVRLALARLSAGWDQLERAERELRAGLRVAFRAGDPALLAELYLEFGALCMRRGDLEAALDELVEGINLCTGGEGAGAEGGPAVLWQLLARYAETLEQSGDAPAALEAARHALRHARRVGSAAGEARVHALLATLYEAAKDFKLAADHRVQALELARRLGDRRQAAELLIADANQLVQRGGARHDSLHRLREASQLAAEVGWTEGVERTEEVLRASSMPGTTPVAPSR